MSIPNFVSVSIGLLALATGVVMYSQSDYTVKTERAIMVRYNQDLCESKIHFFKYNRTYTALNASILLKQDLPHDIQLIVQAYRFASNEYRLFPLRFSADLCSSIEKDEFGLSNVFKCGNFTRCPLRKGTLHICNWGPDYVKFPPYMIHGQYMLSLQYLYLAEEAMLLEWYLKIEGIKPF